MNIVKITDLDIKNKRVLIRSDFNVPMQNGNISSNRRIFSSLPTIEYALEKDAYVMVMSHFGRPKASMYEKKYSLKPIVDFLSKKVSYPVHLVKNYLDGFQIKKKELFFLENVRFNPGEKENDEFLSKKYANLCDIFVMDAFGSAHRVQSSTYGVAKFAKESCMGLLFFNEIKNLKTILEESISPKIAIVGGAKISTKLNLLNALSKNFDQVIVGGGIANTFIAAQGYNVGISIYEPELFSESRRLLKENSNIFVPIDVCTISNFFQKKYCTSKFIDKISVNEKILDIGPESILKIKKFIQNAKTILWNGPVGAFELEDFRKGTQEIAMNMAQGHAFSAVGGGDTIAALDMFNLTNRISYISTGGGSFLKFLEGKKFPILDVLKRDIHEN